jgi:hypothetical protein
MKSWFFAMVFLAIPAAILVALLISLFRYLWRVIQDRSLYRELDAIEADGARRLAQRAQANAERLNNGCAHDFDANLSSGYPPGVCPKCGLSREPPQGACDHVWQRAAESVPASFCTKCGKQYRPAAT